MVFPSSSLPDATIYAPATAVGQAGVSVFRISGSDAEQVLKKLCPQQDLPEARVAVLRKLLHPVTGEMRAPRRSALAERHGFANGCRPGQPCARHLEGLLQRARPS